MSNRLWDYKFVLLGNLVFLPLLIPMLFSNRYREKMEPILAYLVCWEFKDLKEYLKYEKSKKDSLN